MKTQTLLTKEKAFIPLSIPCLNGKEWALVKECLDTNWVSSVGKFVVQFEKEIAQFTGSRFAVATSSGTAALHVSLIVAGIGPDDEVILPTISFIAPANAIRYVGAWPVFMDVEPQYWQMDVEKLSEFLHKECVYKKGKLLNRKTKRVVKGILPVHILGHPADMDPILALARKFKLVVIEDAAEALGTKYKGRHAGTFGKTGILSFNGNKVITTGGGGMILTDDEKFAKKAKYLTTQAKDNDLEGIHNEIGFNYRLTNIQAALGVGQLKEIKGYLNKKKEIAHCYEQELKDVVGIQLPRQAPWAESAFWLFTICVNKNKFSISSRQLLKKLAEQHIETKPLWHPLYSLPPFKKCFAYRIEFADRLYREALSLPSSVHLNPSEQKRVVAVIKDRKV